MRTACIIGLLLFALPAVVQAQFSFTTNNGMLTIAGYNGSAGVVTIPDTIGGLPVTAIGHRAFFGNPTITNLTIPESITNVDIYAFYFCTNLTAITVEPLNPSYSSADGVLLNSDQSKLFLYPPGRAGSYTTPSSVTGLGDLAFIYCTRLINLIIGSSLTNLGNQQLSSCPNLGAITVETSNPAYSSVAGVLFNKNQTALIQYPPAKNGNYAIPDGVTRIEPFAFLRCANLTSVTIPDSVTSVGDLAFAACLDLVSITIGHSVTNIATGAFSYCGSLSSVTIPESTIAIGDYAFQVCTNLTNVLIGSGVTSIGAGSFAACASITDFALPSSVTSIGNSAFGGCNSLTSVTIPAIVSNIGDSAFGSCTNLKGINVDPLNSFYRGVDGVLFDASQTTLIQFPGGKAGSYAIPSSVTNIAVRAFSSSPSLTSVAVPAGVISIGNSAFGYCVGMNAIVVDPSNTFYSSVEGVLFDKNQTTLMQYPAAKAASYAIPLGVTNIADFAFSRSLTLTNLFIPESLAEIGWRGFRDAPNLLTILVAPASPVYSSVDGVLFSKDQMTLIEFPCGRGGSYRIPDGVTRIAGDAFSYSPKLASVTLPFSVTSIRAPAFRFCGNLTGIYFQGNAPSLDVFGLGLGYAEQATVYYLPGASGWGPTFGSRPTALWQPQMQTSDASFGVRTNQFGFNIAWASGQSVVVEAATNLRNPSWSPLQTNILSADSFYFSDPEWTNYPARFYRLRSP